MPIALQSGDLYERSLLTRAGVVDVLAEVVVHERLLELRDVAVYPRGADRLHVGTTELLALARSALDEFSDAGFEQVRVTGTRLSGTRPGRRVDLVIRLHKEQQ